MIIGGYCAVISGFAWLSVVLDGLSNVSIDSMHDYINTVTKWTPSNKVISSLQVNRRKCINTYST